MTVGTPRMMMRGYSDGLSRIGVRDMLSYQSLMPAGAGTPRYEKPELWFGTANWHGGFCDVVRLGTWVTLRPST